MTQFYQLGLVRRLDRWLHAMPHPVAGRRDRSRSCCSRALGQRGAGSWKPYVGGIAAGGFGDAVADGNKRHPAGRGARPRCGACSAASRTAVLPIAVLIPDPVVRVLSCRSKLFRGGADEALPLLRWRLKKSVPFDVDETVVSWMRQTGRATAPSKSVTAVARQRIMREYEEIRRSPRARRSACLLSSTLAALPLLEERGATLLVRIWGKTLTQRIVHGSESLRLSLDGDAGRSCTLLDPQAMLEEIFPAIAYYQDNWEGAA